MPVILIPFLVDAVLHTVIFSIGGILGLLALLGIIVL
jgi:hypothetical protein